MRLTLSKARTGGELANTGYVIFACTLIVGSALFEGQAGTAPGLHVAYEGLQRLFGVLLQLVHLDRVPHANHPLTFSAVLVAAGLVPVKRTRHKIGMASADAALTFLDYFVRFEEWLIRHRTFSSILLLVLLTLFGNGVYVVISAQSAAERAEAAYRQWLDLLRATVLETTMVPADGDKYHVPQAFWSQSALDAMNKTGARMKYGNQVNKLVDGLYAALAQNTNLCVDIDSVLRNSPPWPTEENEHDELVKGLASVHALIRARGFEQLLQANCPLPAANLNLEKEALDQIAGTALQAARLTLIGLVYSHAWRYWMKPGASAADLADLAKVCRSPEQCIGQGYWAYTSQAAGNKDEYQEIKRRNNLVDFLIHLAEGDLTRLNASSIPWLLSPDELPRILGQHVAELEEGTGLYRLGGYISYLTLAQAHAVLALQGAQAQRPAFARRAAAYLDISSTLSTDGTLRDLGPSICRLAKDPAYADVLRSALMEPVDRSAQFLSTVRRCP